MTQPGTQVPRVPCPPCLPAPAPPDVAPFALTADGAARGPSTPAPLFGDTSTDTSTAADTNVDQVDAENDGDAAPDTSTDTAP